MASNMILHLIHMSEERIINCGINRISRNVTNQGVMKGIPIFHYVLFDKDAADRSQGLLPWIRFW